VSISGFNIVRLDRKSQWYTAEFVRTSMNRFNSPSWTI
jgi:hypothetical protein